MSESTQLTKVESQPPAIEDMLSAVMKTGITSENIQAVEKIVQLYERMQDRKAEKEFAAAFVTLQAEMPKVQATRPVPNKDGSLRYRFAAFEDLMEQLHEHLQRNGFTVSFSSRVETDRLISTCTLQHTSGHKRSNEFAVRIGSGPPGATVTQADGAAATYAKRFALTEALNIVVGHMDNDARLLGSTEFITDEQAEELERRVALSESDKLAFLKFAGAKTYAEIPAAKYGMLDQLLTKKEQRGK